ncbi:uncharacterized protein HMPREF1541_01511 [Cyphellophora europaea CBS 101466]|uniref:Heterokaryon incompatibility domain-containing protein n=1 Tax=Cyphellophora europaea (strain CBS 101466) TaxID=1220924 RepID=W2S116_CYPE1|nr:uncharacterized protein HMPREF1541_01511 [Cyphellophora europaea CBS 101466]ETN42357.1 hypothetical protein HMPREF1541_01511 [Cyphellophora europaea CBS 101466]
MHDYRYKPLLSDTAFRLVQLLKSDGDIHQPLLIKVTEFEITAAPPFQALSYTWKSPFSTIDGPDESSADKRAICDAASGDTILVETNLWHALRQLHQPYDVEFWDSTSQEKTPLHCAAEAGNLGLVRSLLAKGADPEAVDKFGDFPLHYAAFNGHTDVVRLFVEAGVRTSHRDHWGRTAFACALEYNRLDTVAYMYQNLLPSQLHSFSTTDRSADTESPVYEAAASGYIDVVREHLHHGRDVDLRDDHGRTLLHHAILNNHVEVIELLRAAGADENALDRDKTTPRELMRKVGRKSDDVAELLELGRRRLAQEKLWRPQYFWIDAICINQADLSEREAQVAMMGEIFRSADAVRIWLGPSNDSSNTAIDTIQRVAVEMSINPVRGYEYSASGLVPSGIPFTEEEEVALHSFLRRTWFKRAWVVQEFLSAKQLVVQCGARQIGFQDITHMMDVMMDWYHGPGAQQSTKWTFPTSKSGRVLARLSWIKQLYLHYSGAIFPGRMSLSKLMQATQLFECDDDRDKYHSLLGIARGPRSTDLQWPLPDYSLPSQDLFCTIARLIMVDDKNLELLSYCDDYKSRSAMFPSWVPFNSNAATAASLDHFTHCLPRQSTPQCEHGFIKDQPIIAGP